MLNLAEELSPETLAALQEFLSEQQTKVRNHDDEDWEFAAFIQRFILLSRPIRSLLKI